MRLHGYCTVCRRVRPVRATGHALALAVHNRGVVQGTCAECEEQARNRNRPRGK